jgi:hypothetical protein
MSEKLFLRQPLAVPHRTSPCHQPAAAGSIHGLSHSWQSPSPLRHGATRNGSSPTPQRIPETIVSGLRGVLRVQLVLPRPILPELR